MKYIFNKIIVYSIRSLCTDRSSLHSTVAVRFFILLNLFQNNLKITFFSVSARVGELKISTDIDCPNCPRAVDHAIEKVLIHSRFVSAFEGYDIALIKLKHRVNITGRFVKPICLPIENFQRLNKSGDGELQSMGFGKTETSNESDSLLKTSIPFYPFVDCQIVYPPGPQLKRGLVEGQLCAGQFKFTSKSIGDTCRGENKIIFYFPRLIKSIFQATLEDRSLNSVN